MAAIVGPPANVIRNRQINRRLARVLEAAADEAGVETVQITSGGQPGTTGRRTGSTRHDGGNAADLKLLKNGRALNFTLSADRPVFETFVTAAVAKGATGIGAGVDYMGPQTIHVGFGSPAVWGAGGRSVNAPRWLKDAVARAGSRPATRRTTEVPISTQPDLEPGRFVVGARGGLRLRGGPGIEFGIITTLEVGRELTVLSTHDEWARVDLEGDGLFDGYVFAAYLIPTDPGEHHDVEDESSESGVEVREFEEENA